MSLKFTVLPRLCVWLFESTETFVLIKTGEGPMRFCFHQSSYEAVQRRSRSCIQLIPFIWWQHWGTIKSELWWSEGLAAPTTSSPDVSTKSFPHLVRQRTHTPCSPVARKFKLQRCCRQMSSPGGWFGHISSHIQHLGVPRHRDTFIISTALWQRCSKAWIWQSVLWVFLMHFLVAELLKSISGHNFQAVFYDYKA